MSISLAVAALLVLATIAGIGRARRKSAAWTSLSIALQPLSAVLFYLLLFPPSMPISADTLTVLTPGAMNAQVPWLKPAVALPGAEVSPAIERAPDLATALRHHPQTRIVAVIGDGLPPRDRDALARVGLRFDAAAEHGLLELQRPPQVQLGTQWPLSGRVAAPTVQVELHDPSGAIVDSVRPDRDGRFMLTGVARAPGPSRFELRLLDAKQALIETASVPVVARGGEPISVILRVGAPAAEFKYWRRWAADAGIALRLRAGLSENIELRDGDTTLTADALQQSDLVSIDERAWTTLAANEKQALMAAVHNGLGLLLRIGGPVDPAVATDWAALGVKIENTEIHGVTLDHRTGLRDRSSFSAAPARVMLAGGVPLLEADDGEWLASWRSEGRGRIGSWQLLDSYRLSLLGEPARYGALWSQTIAALSRPRTIQREPRLPGDAWIDERLMLCELGATAAVVGPDGARSELMIDRDHCAALWPGHSGWHQLQTDAGSAAFYVRAADDGASLRAARDRRETRRGVREPATVDRQSVKRPLPRGPLFLLWLLIAAVLWWRERPTAAASGR
jgi:hypothetical protein